MYAASSEEMIQRNIPILPQSLDEALDELERDDVIRSALGSIAADFIALKRAEWNDFHRQVSPWEVERYLTML
jgi:glutamine synthetase